MLRLSSCLLAGVLFVAPLAARADTGSVPAPDGTLITRENFPTAIVDRPLVTPPGMVAASVGVSNVNLTSAQTPSVDTSVSYSIGQGFELEAQGEVLYDPDVELIASYLLMRNAAVRLWAEYNFANGTNENRSETAFGLGVPLKFKIPKVPIAIGGLDNLLEVNFLHWPSETVMLGGAALGPIMIDLAAADGVETYFRLPVWIQFSPLRVLSLELGAEGYALLSNNIQPTTGAVVVVNPHYRGLARFFGEVVVTVRHVDIGVEVQHYVYLYDNSAPTQTTLGEVFVTVRF